MEINKQITTDARPQQDDLMDNDANLTQDELQLLDNAGEDEEEAELRRASLDNTDDDGEQLNESSLTEDRSGADLDVPGAEEDDDNEALGEEDEENNAYSLGGDGND